MIPIYQFQFHEVFAYELRTIAYTEEHLGRATTSTGSMKSVREQETEERRMTMTSTCGHCGRQHEHKTSKCWHTLQYTTCIMLVVFKGLNWCGTEEYAECQCRSFRELVQQCWQTSCSSATTATTVTHFYYVGPQPEMNKLHKACQFSQLANFTLA